MKQVGETWAKKFEFIDERLRGYQTQIDQLKRQLD
jgi:hypothetical protein